VDEIAADNRQLPARGPRHGHTSVLGAYVQQAAVRDGDSGKRHSLLSCLNYRDL
jgi:hypothetical protein